MATVNHQNIDDLERRIDGIPILSPQNISRVLPLYIRVRNDRGILNTVSAAYIDNYDGSSVYKRFRKFFDQMYETFLRNAMNEDDIRAIFRKIAVRENRFPTNVTGMKTLMGMVYEETHARMKYKKLAEGRMKLMEKFKSAVKKYLHLTYSLGFNVPSECAKYLASNHRIDKYMMSGEFPVILLPFMPEIEKAISTAYDKYEMGDAKEIIDGRYFNHRDEWSTIAVEIKSVLPKTISNFSDYFDRIYIDTYYNMMLKRQMDGKKKDCSK